MISLLSHMREIRGKISDFALGSFAILMGMMPLSALAQSERPQGYSVDGQMDLQISATPIMDSIIAFHNGVLMWVITGIVVLVSVIMVYIMLRYNSKVNPTPSKTTHNTMIEIVWTVAPIVILIVIAIPSFGVLADQQTIPDGERKYLGSNIFSYGEVELPAPELTIKATGVQWNWDYDYMDYEGVDYSSFMLSDEERLSLKPGEPRLLATDFDLVVPVGATVRVQVTASDVIHSFAVPSFGVKIDGVPGRLNETWFNVQRTGMYYGQCSELCGKDHAFMPISVRVVSKEEFTKWIEAFQAGGVESAAAVLTPII